MHRQTAMAAIQHMALGVAGFGCEDALIHLLNYVWPNIFETSPHVVQAFMGAIEGLRVAVGPSKILQYTLQVSALLKKQALFERFCGFFSAHRLAIWITFESGCFNSAFFFHTVNTCHTPHFCVLTSSFTQFLADMIKEFCWY